MPRPNALNGVAQSIAHKFSTSAEYIVGCAWAWRFDSITLDLLSTTFAPAVFNESRNTNLANLCRDNLRRLLAHYPAIQLQSANLLIDEISLCQENSGVHYFDARYEVVMMDMTGRIWSGVEQGRHIMVGQTMPPAGY